MADSATRRQAEHDASRVRSYTRKEGTITALFAARAAPALLHAALGVEAFGDEVAIRLDGRSLRVTLVVDPVEHRRRLALGVGAVTSTGLLHALWLVPSHVPVAAADLPQIKAERLRDNPALAFEDDAGFHRHYSPAGQITAMAVVGRDADRVLDATVTQSPVFRRVAIVDGYRRRSVRALMARSEVAGIGLALLDGDHMDVPVPAPAAIRGAPGVFRWWIGEVAYRAWRQDRIQAVS